MQGPKGNLLRHYIHVHGYTCQNLLATSYMYMYMYMYSFYLKVGTPLSALMPAPDSTTMLLAFARISRNAFMSLDGPDPVGSDAITADVIKTLSDQSGNGRQGNKYNNVNTYVCASCPIVPCNPIATN